MVRGSCRRRGRRCPTGPREISRYLADRYEARSARRHRPDYPTTERPPPPEVAAATKVVDDWLKQQPPAGTTVAPREASAIERFKLLPRSDNPTLQPGWKDPRHG
jgi:hypothetical protein